MRVYLALLFLCAAYLCPAQESSKFIKFGKVTAADLKMKVYPIDSNANAVVLSDIGEAAVVGNNKNWFSISFTRHRVVHILNKSGYEEADVEIPLYTDGQNEEKLETVKAITYNLEGGKVVETKLQKSAVFKEKRNRNLIIRKFTFPNVKEGSIVEYEYKVTSDYIWNLDPWNFQGGSPELWSEYRLRVPQFFTYAFFSHGYQPFYINDKKDGQSYFTVADNRSSGATDRVSFNSGVTDYRWVMKDVPELKPESYTTSVRNHIARIEFQLSSQGYPLTPHDYRNSWTGLTKELLNSEYFGGALDKNNGWMADDVKPLLNASTETAKARNIFDFVRDNFTCTNYSTKYMDQTLKNVMKSRKGNVAEINLLLTAMLRYANIDADPVILSTTDNGYALEAYPMTSTFNYVICRCTADGKTFYLDGSRPRLGFGKLPVDCYNGHARVVNEQATPVYFWADSLEERKVTAMFITTDSSGEWRGSLNQTLGMSQSYDVRKSLAEKGKEAVFKDIAKEYGESVHISDTNVDSLTRYTQPLGLRYHLQLDSPTDDVFYINPMFGERWKKNPFTAAQRYYPVEMPYTMNEMYLLTMQVPEGYKVDELPKSLIAKLDEKGSAYFEYWISQSGNTISLRCTVRCSRTLFGNDEYNNLREFFNLVVNKQNEQIVFKKQGS